MTWFESGDRLLAFPESTYPISILLYEYWREHIGTCLGRGQTGARVEELWKLTRMHENESSGGQWRYCGITVCCDVHKLYTLSSYV